MDYRTQFDAIIVNDDLATTLQQARTLVEEAIRPV
jgi:guanylate kinase